MATAGFSTTPVVTSHITGTTALGRSCSKTNPVQTLSGRTLKCNAWYITDSHHLLWHQRRALWIYPACRNTVKSSMILTAWILLCSWVFRKHSHNHGVFKYLFYYYYYCLFLLQWLYQKLFSCLWNAFLFMIWIFQCFKITATRASRQLLKQNLLREFLPYSCGYCWFQFIHFFSNVMLNK